MDYFSPAAQAPGCHPAPVPVPQLSWAAWAEAGRSLSVPERAVLTYPNGNCMGFHFCHFPPAPRAAYFEFSVLIWDKQTSKTSGLDF